MQVHGDVWWFHASGQCYGWVHKHICNLDWSVCTITWLWTKALLWLYYCSDICVKNYCSDIAKCISTFGLVCLYYTMITNKSSTLIVLLHGMVGQRTSVLYILYVYSCLSLCGFSPCTRSHSTWQIILKIWAVVAFRCSMANIYVQLWNLNFPFV
jgi:hypothetical protein